LQGKPGFQFPIKIDKKSPGDEYTLWGKEHTRRVDVSSVQISDYIPGAIGRVTEMHAVYYQQSWGFGQFFESKVAAELSSFLDRFDKTRDGFWTACMGGVVEGSVAIDGKNAASEGAHLRWFIMSPGLQGQGAGNTLMEKAIGFCKACGYTHVYLWTFEGLHAARHLYEKFGFKLSEQTQGSQWGTTVLEQKFTLTLPCKTG
jgi:GNAT superfamily N-acetyltransferase